MQFGDARLARACLLMVYPVVGDEGGKQDATKIGRRVFVVSGRDPAPLFEPVESAFDGVSLAIEILLEGRRSAAGRSLGFAAFDLVRPFGDRVRDPFLSQRFARGGFE